MRIKIPLITIPFIVVFLVILGVSLYANFLISFSMETMEFNIEHRLIAESKRLANMVSAEELDKYRVIDDMELPAYRALRQQLLGFSIDADVLYAYFIRPVEGELQYIIDNDFNEETRVGLDTPPYDPSSMPWMMSTLEGNAVCSGLGNYTPNWEGLLSGYAPVFDKYGNVAAIAGVDIDDKPIVHARLLVSILTVVQILAIIAIFAGGIIYFVFLYRQKVIAQKANASKTWFLSQMSHEMRTPLTVMSTYAQFAVEEIRENGANEQTLADLATISGEAKRLAEMADGTLKILLSESETLSDEQKNAPVDIGELSTLIARLFEPAVKRHGCVLNTVIKQNIPRVLGDSGALTQLFWNILQNAVIHSQCKNIVLSVEAIHHDVSHTDVIITIKDDGCGIDADLLPHIFERGKGEKSGSGLGLPICRDIARRHGGDITISSERALKEAPHEAHGTTVVVQLHGNVEEKKGSFIYL